MDLYIIDKNNEIPSYSYSTLETRLEQAITKDGIQASKDFATFSLVAEPISVSKNAVTGLVSTLTASVEINLFIANNFTGDRFFSSLLRVSGAGKSEDKAIMRAFSQISASNAELTVFLQSAKAKVIRYYDENAGRLIAEARNYATTRQFEKGLCILGAIPVFCKEYPQVHSALLEVWGQYINFDGRTNLQKARSLWNAGQNREAASAAGEYLAKIYPDADCYAEAEALGKEIQARIGDEWNFAKKMWQDNVDLESQRIEAARAVGVAYGNNQKPTTYIDRWAIR